MVGDVQNDSKNLNRKLRTVQTKVAKEMDEKDSHITSLTVRIRRPKNHKKVQYDSNGGFPSMEAIVRGSRGCSS